MLSGKGERAQQNEFSQLVGFPSNMHKTYFNL